LYLKVATVFGGEVDGSPEYILEESDRSKV